MIRHGGQLAPEVPPILTVTGPRPRAAGSTRLLAGGIALACLAVLVVGALLPPAAEGFGTHQKLGLPPCGTVAAYGMPCMTCGYTTAFSHFAKGDLLSSAITQPGGLAAAIATAAAVWIGGYVATTGRPAHRLLGRVPMWLWITLIATLLLGGWAYKIVTFDAAA